MIESPRYRPVFVCGCDRSGTTLLGSMLGNHPDAIVTPESQFLTDLYAVSGASTDPSWQEQALATTISHWRLKIWGIANLRTRLEHLLEHNEWTFRSLVESITSLYAQDHGKTNASFWINHTPGYVRHVSMLTNLFPDSKFIHLVRDGRGVAASILPLNWGSNTPPEAASWWMKSTGTGAAAEIKHGPDRIIRIKFEDLVCNPTSALQRVSAFVGLEYFDTMTKGDGFVVPEYTHKQHRLVGSPADQSRANACKRSLRRRDIEIFEAVSGDFLDYLGYDLMFKGCPRPPGRWEKRKLSTLEVVQSQANLMRSRFRKLAILLTPQPVTDAR